MIKQLIIGGVHGDETTGIELVNAIKQQPIQNVDGILANPLAVQQKRRFIETDLNRSFGAAFPISYEEKLAAEISLKLQNYELILDFHNTNDSTTCAIVCNYPNQLQLITSVHFGFDKIVIMPNYGCLIGVNSEQSMSFEISDLDTEQFSIEQLLSKIENLPTTLNATANSNLVQITVYQYVASVKKATFRRLQASLNRIENFVLLTSEQKNILGLDQSKEYCPIFYGCEAYADNAFHMVEQLNKLSY